MYDVWLLHCKQVLTRSLVQCVCVTQLLHDVKSMCCYSMHMTYYTTAKKFLKSKINPLITYIIIIRVLYLIKLAIYLTTEVDIIHAL
jgi:hypothetical protein